MGNGVLDPEFQRTLQNIRNALSMGGPYNAPNAAGMVETAGRGADQWGTVRGGTGSGRSVAPNRALVPVNGQSMPLSEAQIARNKAAWEAQQQAERVARAQARADASVNARNMGPSSKLAPENTKGRNLWSRAKYNARNPGALARKPIPLTGGKFWGPLAAYGAADVASNIVSDVGQTLVDTDIAEGDTRRNVYDDIENYGTWGVPDPIEAPLRALSQGLGFNTFNFDTLRKNATDAEVAARQQPEAPPPSIRDYQESTTDINEALLDRTGMPQGIEGPGGRGLYIKNTYNDPANVAGRAEDQAKRNAEAAIVQQRRDDLAEAVDLGKFRTAGPKTIEERRSNLANEAIEREYKQALGGVKDQKLLLAMRKARSAEDKDIAINLQKRGTGKNFRVLDQGAAAAASMMTSKRVSDLLREGEDPWTSPDGTMVRVAAKTLLENELATTHGFIDRFTQLWRDRGYLNDPEITPEMFTSGDIYVDQNRNIRVGDRVIKPDNPQVAQILQFLQRMAGVTE